MDARYDDLKKNPAVDAYGSSGGYPIKWTELQGDIFHRVIIDMYDAQAIKNCLESGRTNQMHR